MDVYQEAVDYLESQQAPGTFPASTPSEADSAASPARNCPHIY